MMKWRTIAGVLLAGGLLCCSGAAAEFADDTNNIGLWHMESSITYGGGRVQTVDDDSSNPTRNHHLVMGNSGDATLPTLVSGGLYGKALSLDGTNDSGYVQYWINGITNKTIAVDVSFKANTVGVKTQTIVCAGADSAPPNGFELGIESDGRVSWTVWGSGGTGSVKTAGAVSAGQWHTVHAVLASNAVSLQVDGAAPITQPYYGYLTCNARPYVGSTQTGLKWFGGLVDEVKIAGVPLDMEPVHPSLLFTAADLPAMRAKVQGGWLTNAFVKMKVRADLLKSEAATPPSGASAGRQLNYKVNTLALTGYILDDPSYLVKAIDLLCASAELYDANDFNGFNFEIAVGDAAHAYAVGYDWLYPYMNPVQRTLIRNEIEEFGQWIFDYSDYYSTLDPIPVSCNHNAVTYGALGLCALSLGRHTDWQAKAVAHTQGYFEYARDDDGYNYEGLGYYAYGSLGAITFSAALLKSGGPDLVDAEHKNRLIPNGILRQVLPWGGKPVTMNDSDPYISPSGGFMHLIAKYQDRVGLWTWLRLLGPSSGGGDGTYGEGPNPAYYGGSGCSLPYVIVFADETLQPLSPADAGLDPSFFFTSTNAHPGGRASFRSGWGDLDALATFTSGFDQHRGHNHRDENSFTFYALGEEFGIDPGYNPWETRSHNAILVDGIGQDREAAEYDVYGRVLDHADYGNALYIKGDARDAYINAANVVTATRKMLFVKGPQPYLVIADDIQKASGTGQFKWLFHTEKSNAIAAGPGNGAVITGGKRGAKCHVKFLWPQDGLQVSEKNLAGETFVARGATYSYASYFKELQAVATATNPLFVAVLSAAESGDTPPTVVSTGSPAGMQITVSFSNGTVDTIGLTRETMTFARADPPPVVEISNFGVDATNIWLVFNGTNTLIPRPWYSTNLASTNWYPVPNWQSAFSGGTYSQRFQIMAGSPQYFFKVTMTNSL